jgi:hypothetical protein
VDDQRRDAKEIDFSLGAAKMMGDYGLKIDEQEINRALVTNEAATGLADHVNSQVDRQEDRQDAKETSEADRAERAAQQKAKAE